MALRTYVQVQHFSFFGSVDAHFIAAGTNGFNIVIFGMDALSHDIDLLSGEDDCL
ncbi:hypothetical Protein YC6258_01038 [Gynuella sunshinyii YC6258]|uniref:Uncharacterized protein n=1 Tax=Gynuella sunshinyii YC6258 TaxID=1445510 RepID=A0A0C5VIA6_9GAMM|nr:hypothetical Protein YC6258_01038 [Gynuella sunshinyii YC6258]